MEQYDAIQLLDEYLGSASRGTTTSNCLSVDSNVNEDPVEDVLPSSYSNIHV